VLAQVEIAEREQELIKGIEMIRQKMLKSTYEASQKIIELNTELAELEVCSITKLNLFFNQKFKFSSAQFALLHKCLNRGTITLQNLRHSNGRRFCRRQKTSLPTTRRRR
jgi:hypothetical protein